MLPLSKFWDFLKELSNHLGNLYMLADAVLKVSYNFPSVQKCCGSLNFYVQNYIVSDSKLFEQYIIVEVLRRGVKIPFNMPHFVHTPFQRPFLVLDSAENLSDFKNAFCDLIYTWKRVSWCHVH